MTSNVSCSDSFFVLFVSFVVKRLTQPPGPSGCWVLHVGPVICLVARTGQESRPTAGDQSYARSDVQAEFLMLAASRVLIAVVGRFIALARDTAKDHGEGASMAGRRMVGVSPMDGHAMVDDSVARFQQNRPFAGKVVRGVIDDPLGKAQNTRAGVLAKTFAMRADDVPQAAIFRINFIECQPDSKHVGWSQTKIIVVLMRRRHMIGSGGLIKPLRLIT